MEPPDTRGGSVSAQRAELQDLRQLTCANAVGHSREDSAIWLLSIKRNADLNGEVDAHSTCVGMLIRA
jgi:hypothetical protein